MATKTSSAQPEVKPSSRYGVVIVLAFFLTEVIVDGVRFSFGIYFVELLAEFGRGRAETALVGSLLSGTYNLGGPIYAFTVHRLGCRLSAMLGSLVSTSGFLLSFFAPNLQYLIFTFGCMQGFGYGLLVMSGTVAVGRYFVKNRSLAIGIGLCGSGVGTLILPPVLRHVIDQLTWRGSMFITASIILQGCVLGVLYRQKHDVDLDVALTKGNIDGAVNNKQLMGNRTADFCEVDVDIEDADTQLIDHKGELPETIKEKDSSRSTSKLSKQEDSGFPESDVNGLLEIKKKNVSDGLVNKNLQLYTTDRRSLTGSHRSLQLIVYKEIGSFGSKHSLNGIDLESDTGLDDFDTQSMETTHVYEVDSDLESENVPKFSNAFIENTFPKVLMTDIRLVAVMIAAFLYGMPSVVPLTIVPDYAMEVGCTSSEATWLLSAIGIGSTVGRAGAGWIADLPCANRRAMLRMSFLLCGILSMLCSLLTDFETILLYALSYGTFFGATFTVQAVVNMDIFGARYIAQLVGMQMLSYGIAQFIGTPVAGLLHDETGDYRVSFLFAGGTCVASALVHSLLCCIDRSKRSA